MNKPNLEQLDKYRQEGFRPGVVLCLISNKRILMVYKKEHKLWQIPQGRVNNKEEIDVSLPRVVQEEMGKDFAGKVDYKSAQYVDLDQMEFKPGRHQIEPLVDDQGKEINMLGKIYFFAALQCADEQLDITKSQFDQHYWMSFREAYFLSERIYQRGKRRITMKILNTLFNLGLTE